MFTVSKEWKTTYPQASIGILAMTGVANPKHHAALEERKQKLEEQLRTKFAGVDRATLKQLPEMQAYNSYYKRFKKSYHVQLQLESVVLRGKSIPSVAAVVEAMLMAELKNMLLTAGHDLEKVQLPVRIDVAQGGESYIGIHGKEEILKAGDMFIADNESVLSSIIYGPDKRTQIRPATTQVLFTVYALEGLTKDAVRQHLEDMRGYALLIAPEAQVEELEVYGA
jgi:DNA/RNA-binding domain of Phe-tRNA-synthetase-like protein